MGASPSREVQAASSVREGTREYAYVAPNGGGTRRMPALGAQFDPKAVEDAAAAEGTTKEPERPRWERLPSGTPLKVYWEGSDAYYDCKILDWRVGYSDEKELIYTHRCA